MRKKINCIHVTGPKNQVMPGIEPKFRDSESPVITVTLQDHVHGARTRLSSAVKLKKSVDAQEKFQKQNQKGKKWASHL